MNNKILTRSLFLPLTVLGLATTGCAKKSSSGSTATSPSASSGGATTTTTKTLTTTNAQSIYTSVNATAASTGSAQGFSGGLALDDGPVSGDGDTAHCSDHGEPISATASKNTSGPDSGSTVKFMSSSDPAYVAGKTYCVITHDTGDPESLRGALAQMGLFSCMIGNNATFDGQPHDIDTTSAAFAACFTGSSPAAEGVTKATLTAANPPAFGDLSWDFSTEFSVTVQGTTIDMKMLWKSSGGQTGFASLMPPVGTPDTTGKSHDAFIVLVDTNTKRLTLDSASQRLYSQGFARRIRVTADGTFNANNTFASVNQVSFVESQLNAAGPSGNSAPANPLAFGSSNLITANGDTTHGFLTENYNLGTGTSAEDTAAETADYTQWVPVTGVDGTVFDGDGSGTGVTAIKLSSDTDLGVVLYPNYATYVDPVTWFATAPVPTWTTASLAAVQSN